MYSVIAETYAFTVFCFIGMFLILLPLPWHFQARNFGTLLFIAWSFLANLIYFVDSLVWRHDMIDRASTWCDISTKILVGINVAYPCASLAINRRLYTIATAKRMGPNSVSFVFCSRFTMLVDHSPLLVIAVY